LRALPLCSQHNPVMCGLHLPSASGCSSFLLGSTRSSLRALPGLCTTIRPLA
jgi:hypothetical protein